MKKNILLILVLLLPLYLQSKTEKSNKTPDGKHSSTQRHTAKSKHEIAL